ncbi:MAG: SRPBCC family protein [bacterium]
MSVIGAERVVAAPAQRIFDVLADPAEHPGLSGDGSVRASHEENPTRLHPGARFGMDMKIGAPYKITNRVIEYDEGRRLAWRHFNGHVWRWTITPTEDGSLVREEWDPRRAHNQWFLRWTFRPGRVRRNIERSLDRLAARVGN